MLRVEQAVILSMRVRRCFGSFFPWLCRAVSLQVGEEEEKAQPAQPVDVDDVLECINCDLFTDRLGALLSDAALASEQPAERDSRSAPPLPPSVSLIASDPSVRYAAVLAWTLSVPSFPHALRRRRVWPSASV